jgi:N-carbamoylputrescine amidase
MQPVRVALVQLAWPGKRELMMDEYRHWIAEGAVKGASIICLPELPLSPYFPGARDESGFEWAEPLRGGPTEIFFGGLAQELRVTIVASLFEKADDGHFYDTATIYRTDGHLIGCTRKIHIPSGEGYHETDFFESGDNYPVFQLDALKLAAPTCYDQWFPELARIYAINGAEFVFYPTTIGAEPTDPDIDTQEMWQTVMRGHAITNGMFIGAANRTGEENGVRFYGSSFICDPTGDILAQAGRGTSEVIVADLEPYTLEHWRELFPLLHQRQPHKYQRLSESIETLPPDRWKAHNALGKQKL